MDPNANIPELNRIDDILVKDGNIFKIGMDSVSSYVESTERNWI